MMENQQLDSKSESCGSSEKMQELFDFKKICSSRCNICNSGVLKEIHDFRADGKKLERIVELVKENHDVDVSMSSLSRHFKTYTNYKTELATQVIKEGMLEEVTLQSVHIQRTVELLDLAYDKIKARIDAGTMKLDISDLEKLLKMRYQVLNGENTDEKGMMAIFQKASNEYNLDLQQGVLFKM